MYKLYVMHLVGMLLIVRYKCHFAPYRGSLGREYYNEISSTMPQMKVMM